MREVVVIVIGQTGAGKSEFGNAYLQNSNSFFASDGPDAATIETHAKCETIDGVTRYFIDTQGLDDTQGVDNAHVQQMVSFLKAWEKGVNAIAIVINGQHPRFDAGTQKLIKIIHVFFNNPKFWNNVCIVFTKNYRDEPLNREVFNNEYRTRVQNLIVECVGNGATAPQLPTFFVNSKRFADEQETRDELVAFHAFAYASPVLSTQHVVAPDVRFMRSEEETRINQLVGEKIERQTENIRCKTLSYEDQRREKKTAYDGKTVTYSEWVPTRRWDEVQYEMTEMEKQYGVKVSELKTEIFRTEKHGGRKYVLFGPRNSHQVHDHWDVNTGLIDRQRQKVTNFDGTVNYGDWEVINAYTRNTTQ
jgi:hypothetical protein